MTQYGSLVNTLMTGTRGQPEPEVGMGVTVLMWTDRQPGTIVKVTRYRTGPNKGQVRAFEFQQDRAFRTDTNGMSDAQTYRFEPDPDAPVQTATRRKDGSFRRTGGNTQVRVGDRSRYHDYSF